MSTLAERIKENVSPLENTDLEWVAFVKDHRSFIMDGIKTVPLDAGEMHFSRHRCSTLLHRMGYDGALAWIVLWLNQIDNNRDFTEISKLKIPESGVIEGLRAQFDTYQSKLAETRAE
jgi:hypothetical protein